MKKIITTCVVCFLCVFLIGCNKQKFNEEMPTGIEFTGVNPQNIGTENHTEFQKKSWKIAHKSTGNQFEIATISFDKIIGCYYEKKGIRVSLMDKNTGKELSNYFIGDAGDLQSICADNDGRIYLLCLNEEQHTIWKIQNKDDIQKINVEVSDLGVLSSVNSFFSGPNGCFYLWYKMSVPCNEVYGEGYEDFMYTRLDRIYVLDEKMNCIGYEQVPESNYNKLIAFLFDESGNPYLLAKDKEGYYTRMVRTRVQKEFEEIRIDGVQLNDIEVGEHCAMSKDGLYYISDEDIHLFYFEQAYDEKIIDLAEAGIFEDDIIYFGTDGADIEILDNYKGSAATEYSKLVQGEENERTVVTLGVMQMLPKMKNTVATFNRNQTSVTVEPIVYAENYDLEAGFEKLKLDLISGKAPDLIMTEGIDMDLLANTDALLDLYSFMENDKQCGRDALVESVLNAYEMNGKLYVGAPSFYIYSMWGAKSTVCGRKGVGMGELMHILQENGVDINSIYGFSADESALRTLCALSMDEFIDWEAGTCNFLGESFQNVLKFAKEYQGKRFESFYNAVRNKEILFIIQNMSCVEDYSLWSGIFGETIEFIGYPTTSGSGSVAYFTEGLAIYSKTNYPSECWSFVKNYILEGYEKGMGFPIVKTKLEKMFEESLQEDTVQNVNGGTVKVCRKLYQEKNNKNATVKVFKASKSDVEAVRKLIESISGKHAYHNDIMNIIDEEAESYFCGQKSIEQAAKIIQNRVQLYLDENK